MPDIEYRRCPHCGEENLIRSRCCVQCYMNMNEEPVSQFHDVSRGLAGYSDGEHLLPPKNYLVESILVLVLCCMPFGVVALVYALQVNGHYKAGYYDEAERCSLLARKWSIWGFCGGILFILICAGAILLRNGIISF